ncbi:MAG: hypothetical protein KDC53_01795, partial [Saprospiraceae bacterium]|nr:hypothetical protein [Saprospiraceae bacterium]
MGKILLFGFLRLIFFLLLGIEHGLTQDFSRLKYNNPDLVVDLGVGLWAWPLPIDKDGDGDMDLIVSCPDVPFNGVYYFENTTGKVKNPIFEKPIWLAPSRKNLQISYVDDVAYVTSRGEFYHDFQNQLFDDPELIMDTESLEKKHQKIRFSLWKYVDYEGDGDLDLIAGIDDWGDYGW